MALSQLRNAVVAAVLCALLVGHPGGCSARSLLGGDGAGRSLLDAGGHLRAYLAYWKSNNTPPAVDDDNITEATPEAEEPETVAEEPKSVEEESETVAEEPETVAEEPETVAPPPASAPTSPVPSSENLVWGYDDTSPDPNWTRPGLYEPYVDAAYGTTITRVTDAGGTRFDRNKYSRHQAESADGKYFMSYHGDGQYHVYERTTGNLVLALPVHSRSEPQWNPSSPSKMRYVEGEAAGKRSLRLFEIDVLTAESEMIADFTDRIQAALPGAEYAIDRSEASPSADGSRYCWFVRNANDEVLGLMTYDVASDTVLGTLPASKFPDKGRMDALSMSPSGKFVLTQHLEGTYVYNADLSKQRLIFAGAEHSDIAVGADGGDAYVYIDFTAGENGGWLMSVDMASLAETRVLNIYDGTLTSLHISGKAFNKPGWVAVSTYNCKDAGGWACDKVFAAELKPNGRILNLAHTHNCGQDYWTETHAVANRDFTRVYYNTDSGSCGIDAEVMMIDVPPFN